MELEEAKALPSRDLEFLARSIRRAAIYYERAAIEAHDKSRHVLAKSVLVV